MARLNKKAFKHKRLVALAAIVVLLIAGYWAYGQVTSFSNKQEFEKARITTDKIYNSITMTVGQPVNSSKLDTCSRSYQELSGYGQINCDIDRSILYSVSGREDAQKKIDDIQSIINQTKAYVPSKPIHTSIETTGVLNKNYYGVQNFYKLGSLDCTSKYVYDTPDDTFLKLKGPGIPLYVVIGCTGLAKKQYYPLNQ